ncbi:NAD(P)-binding domain-containing protein [Gorillibacterium sp. sgz5001074]|uniref:NAD(P)-binding domain-containing protein n=1 Tax=Gorillibacterium sp. sgz5001074 TaxID=3446695 RepID=UPI003F66E3C3
MKNIGFIGLGTMGMPMAVNLLKNGYPLTVYNRTAPKAESLQAMGASIAKTPAQLAKEADVIFTNVSNDQALLDVVFGKDGLMEGIRPGLTVIDCSTVSPDTSRKVAAELEAHAADFLDAPVTGSKPAAEAGTLVFMVGGKPEVFEEQLPLFEVLGSKALHMGVTGSGSYAKLAHNTIVGINAVGLMEGMSMAAKAGLDPNQFLEIVTAGGANSRQAELKGMKIINRDFSNQFSTALMLKDLLLAQKLTSGFQLPAPMLQAATSVFQMGLSKGLGDQDLSSVIQCYEEWMNKKIVKAPPGAAGPKSSDRRRANRISLGIKLLLSVYQWEQEGSFSGQNIEGVLHDLSESGIQIGSRFPLSLDMFVVIHFPREANLPPITGKIIRIESKEGEFRYGCMLSGLPPYTRIKLEEYIKLQTEK